MSVQAQRECGGNGKKDTPVPMPNTAVKPANAESTWGEAPWEDRKPLIKKKALENSSAFLLFVGAVPKGGPL